MSLSVKIPKEIREYQEKIIFGLSLRQLLCTSLAVILALATYWLGIYVFAYQRSVVEYLVIAQSIPLMAIGFFKKNGWYAEKYLSFWWQHQLGKKIFTPQTNLSFTSKQLLSSRKKSHVFIYQKPVSEAQGYHFSRQQTKKHRRLAKESIKKASRC